MQETQCTHLLTYFFAKLLVTNGLFFIPSTMSSSIQRRNVIKWCQEQEESLAPDVQTWDLSEANVLYWRKYLWHCWDFSVHSQSFGARGIAPPCPPCHAPASVWNLRIKTSMKKLSRENWSLTRYYTDLCNRSRLASLKRLFALILAGTIVALWHWLRNNVRVLMRISQSLARYSLSLTSTF